MTIIRANISHLASIEAITQKTIASIYPKYYPMGAVRHFQAHHHSAQIAKDIALGNVYLFLENDTPLGTISIIDNEITRFFILPEKQHRGIGKLLLAFAERLIFNKGSNVTLDTSLPAQAFYFKNGYQVTGFKQVITDNQDVLCYVTMRKISQR
ncbi:GNAT family N-acetyltransferase [Vagococcus sp. BWB3-3]|uniref:GNAT family N-acetyltransferase n=1 Tax=Vagococcus allomyrinae TaxID=2794353 RepID=A0A940P7L6_9ENTE|nr:GNAT family N-acetyltransferase [Vagococcus allomyrinae]MBP1042877.1 GNAT family N-acetyltransferase [Vagococcus allomyrinae]